MKIKEKINLAIGVVSVLIIISGGLIFIDLKNIALITLAIAIIALIYLYLIYS